MIAVCRLRHCERTRAYARRRAQDGLNRREILRCLKRYIARQTYHTLRADLAELAPPQPPPTPTPTISHDARPSPIARGRA